MISFHHFLFNINKMIPKKSSGLNLKMLSFGRGYLCIVCDVI